VYEEDDLLPLSALQDITFCERRCALRHLEGHWEENVATIEGQNLHGRSHDPGTESRGDVRVARGLMLRSLRLGLSGKTDVVEFHLLTPSLSSERRGGEGAEFSSARRGGEGVELSSATIGGESDSLSSERREGEGSAVSSERRGEDDRQSVSLSLERERVGVRVRKKSKVGFARRLRRDQTEAEKRLWQHLRDRRFSGLKFRRQHPVGRYIADFACPDRGLIIELDGGQHALQRTRDASRDRELRERGYRVLRFWDNDVLARTQVVLEAIHDVLFSSPQPSPLRGEGVGKETRRCSPETEGRRTSVPSPLNGRGEGEGEP